MGEPLPLAQRYAATLRKFTAGRQESALEQAHELGRAAIAHGLGVLDMARLHQAALANLLRAPAATQPARALSTAETFFLEALSPFEATHRGFRETNASLQDLIATLEKRNDELAHINDRLKTEVRQRKRSESALRRSEEHFRELFNRARVMEGRLRSLSNQILHAQEEERKRISRELHDETGQALTAISITLAGLNGNGHGVNRQKIAHAQRILRGTMEALHSFAREIRPTSLDELGLVPALRSYLKSYVARTGLHVSFRSTSQVEQLGSARKTVLFRVAQESLTNVARHAKASHVQLRIKKLRGKIRMVIADNGKSFYDQPEAEAERLGLLAMQERVRLVNGRFSIQPERGGGTTVHVVVPLGETAPELPKKFPITHKVKNPKNGVM